MDMRESKTPHMNEGTLLWVLALVLVLVGFVLSKCCNPPSDEQLSYQNTRKAEKAKQAQIKEVTENLSALKREEDTKKLELNRLLSEAQSINPSIV